MVDVRDVAHTFDIEFAWTAENFEDYAAAVESEDAELAKHIRAVGVACRALRACVASRRE